jgi:pimeloyl-ACP methyl ester carboxylesterase
MDPLLFALLISIQCDFCPKPTAKIPGAWLVQIKGAGHDLMFQYPDKFNKVLQTFLSTTTG